LSKIITVANQKGGVGKTTVSMSLIGSLHQRGFRVLGVDLDPQGSLGFSAGLDIENTQTVYEVLKGETPIEDAIRHADMGDFLLSNILLSTAERELNGRDREFLLRKQLERVADDYDRVIIDTPPGLSILTTNAYGAADGLIIPSRTDILGVLAVSQIRETVKSVHASLNPRLKVYGILLNFYNARLTLSREVCELMEQLAKEMNTRVFQAKLRNSVAISEAPAHGESIDTYYRASNASQDFEAFVEELIKIM